jgi:aspartyl aminopeptidase
MAKSESKAKELSKKLERKSTHVWDALSTVDKKKLEALREDYKTFLSDSKTEREAATDLIQRAAAAGFKPVGPKTKSKKLYRLYKNKVVGFATLGKRSVADGVNMIIAHIDAPRLDLKQSPLYEDTNIALGKTHYYGGIKKYQWVTRPLALHGVAITSKGKSVPIVIGESDDDPVLTVLDLLPHLAKKAQYGKKLPDIVTGEKLNVVLGGIPYGAEGDKNRFKLTVLEILNKKYGLVEEDLISAEFEVVPAGPARDVGLDRAFIGGYGHDDRVNSFASFAALLEAKPGDKAQVVICVDKEEIGSYGNTGAGARFVLDFIGDLLEAEGVTGERAIRRAMAESKILSGDVTASINPDWQQVHEKMNAAFTGHGFVLTKFTGSGGKGGASDCSAEFVGEIRNLMNKNKIVWQAAELGKVDEGGGGTVAHYLARHGADVLDAGAPVLAMHSPFELVHVGDFYMTFKAYKVFLEKA